MTATATITAPEAPALSRAQLTNLAVEQGIGTRREVRAISTDDLRALVAQAPPRKAAQRKAAAKAPAKKAAAKAAPRKASSS